MLPIASDRLQLILDISHESGVGEDLIIPFTILPVLNDLDDLQVCVPLLHQSVLYTLRHLLLLHFNGLTVVENRGSSALLRNTTFSLRRLLYSRLIQKAYLGSLELADGAALIWAGLFLLNVDIFLL